jgi:putative SOS response-associated peptidase YedK
MCGRFTLASPKEAIRELFPLFDLVDLKPRYNIAPTQPIAAVRRLPESAQPESVYLRWGLIPSWAEDAKIGNRLINARAETVATKPAFRAAFRQRRCLILADGFYEWQKTGHAKQPYYIRRRDGKPFAFAGLWERFRGAEKPIESCTIVTTDANELMRPLHDRMPVILDRADFETWLAPAEQRTEMLQELLRPCPSDILAAYPISTQVNNPRNEGPACIEPVTDKA